MLLDNPLSLSRGDLKNSIFEMREVNEELEDLTDAQHYILNYVTNKTGRNRLMKRSDINPSELTKYLPNIALFDLEFDEQAQLFNVHVRLLGTAISEFYGEFTGLSTNDERVKQSSAVLPERLVAQVNEALKYRNAVSTLASSSIINKTHIQIRTLTIPMSENDADIDKIFMLLEIRTEHL